MPKLEPLTTTTTWARMIVTDDDMRGEDPLVLTRMAEQLFLIRHFEEVILQLKAESLVHGPAHASIGQEGGAVGCMSALTSGDKINGTHRMHHQFLAKVLNYATPGGYDPLRAEPGAGVRDVISRTMAEIMGLTPGFCGGRGGSMHLRYPEAGVLGSNAIVGGNPPHAVGYAFADKMLKTGNISVTFFGDGALQMGTSTESLNLAALFDAPVIFFVENNLYAVSTHLREQTREQRLTSRGPALGVPAIEVDGMDPFAVRKATQWAIDHIRSDRGPVLIEAKTYRFFHQQGPAPGSAFGYRTKAEEQEWRERDPVRAFPAKLAALGVMTAEQAARLSARSRKLIEDAANTLTEPVPGSNARRIVPSLWPNPAEVEVGTRGDLAELSGLRTLEIEQVPASQMKEVKFLDVIGEAMVRNMQRDERIYVLGEDVHRLRGGTAGGTRGIAERYPERLIGTPICENGFTGMALGMGMNGLRPVVEIMYPDFCLVAADQLFNQLAKVRHMFGGNFAMPVVVRSRVSAGAGYGSQHSMDASGLFSLWPGWRIVAPTTPFDYIGLLNAAVRCDDPVLVVEHNDLFQTTGLVPVDDWDYIVPIGKARIARPGTACTIITYLSMVPVSVDAANETGIDAEVIDLRTLDPTGLDWETIGRSIMKTNRVLIVEQTARGTGHGARLAEEVQERFFDWLDAPVLRVSGTNSAPVVSKTLETAALAGPAEVRAGLVRLMAQSGMAKEAAE
jgi:2-oxoisovalerate dehydrogenase E1 component